LEIIPNHPRVVPERLVDHEERRPEVGVIPRRSKAEWFMWFVRTPTSLRDLGDAALLNVDISKCLRTEVGQVSESGIKGGGSRVREIETTDERSVDLLEWSPLDLRCQGMS
jgi:hypothetical protein